MPALIDTVPAFTRHIRVFIVHTLASTFQAVSRHTLEQSLDLVSSSPLCRGCNDTLAQRRDFSLI